MKDLEGKLEATVEYSYPSHENAVGRMVAEQTKGFDTGDRFAFMGACTGLYMVVKTIRLKSLGKEPVRMTDVEQFGRMFLPKIAYLLIPDSEEEVRSVVLSCVDYAVQFGYLVMVGENLMFTGKGLEVLKPMLQIESQQS